jgi:wobble nucleotide-excising tRNase
MITRILTINDFGVFDDFKWNRESSLTDFKEKNIIYGWNYSGKTTFSRIFSSLRDKTIHPDFTNASFKLKTENGSEIESSSIDGNSFRVFVFNKEYVDAKLIWDSNAKLGEPIAFDVGENTTIRNEIIDLQTKINNANNRKAIHLPSINIFKEFENSRFRDESKTIRLIISNNTIAFDKGHLKAILTPLTEESLDSLIITKITKLEELKKISNSSNDFSNISKLSFESKYLTLKEKVKELLYEEPSKDVVIDILENNKNLYQWTKQGLQYEENKQTCSFCGNSINEGRILELNSYFSNASKELRDKISDLRKSITNEKQSLSNLEIPKSKNDFTEKVRDEIQSNINSYINIKDDYLKNLDELLNELDRKEDGNIFKSIEIKEIFYNVESLDNWIKSVNDIVKNHNSLVANFETERNEARQQLKLHLVANYLKNEDYFDKKNKFEKANKWISAYDNYAKKIGLIKTEKQDSLKTITKGKDELNKFIQRFLNRDDITIDVTDEDKFILLRKNRPAKNLSEGEKTAIAFSYFLVDYESLGIEEMRKTIVFIDDPISSLDTNHIAQVYSLINSFFFRSNIDITNPNKIVNCFKQFFISTHNFEFFSFLRDSHHLKKKKRIKDPTTVEKKDIPNCSFYQIQKLNSEKSIIKRLPNSLRRFKSEYIYLFSLIYNYNIEIDKGGEIYDILIPNALRRFLEIYTLMKIPNEPDSVEKRISHLVDDVNQFKTLNHFSHFTTFEKATKHDELMMVLPTACKELIKLLEIDKKHYESLKKSI